MNYDLAPISDDIAKNILLDHNDDETMLDPITIMLIASLINAVLQTLIPIIQQKCENKVENIRTGAAKPGFWIRWQMNKAIRKAKQKSSIDVTPYGITTKDISRNIFEMVEEIDDDELEEFLDF